MNKLKSRQVVLIGLLVLVIMIALAVFVGLEKKRELATENEARVSAISSKITPGQRMERTVSVGDLQRTYTVFMPRTLALRGVKSPVIVALHPGGATSAYMQQNAPFHLATGSESFVVVYPEGYGKSFNANGCCGVAVKNGVDDVAFFKAIMSDVAKILPIRDKAYVTGFSNGSFMTYKLLCDVPQMIAAAAPFAGAIDMSKCVSGYKIPTLHINGGADTFTLTGNPANVNTQFQHAADTIVPPAEALDKIAARNGCRIKQVDAAGLPALDATCKTYVGCALTAPVSLCIIPNLGHAWPGTGDNLEEKSDVFKQMLGGTGPYRPELDGTSEIIKFFLKY